MDPLWAALARAIDAVADVGAVDYSGLEALLPMSSSYVHSG